MRRSARVAGLITVPFLATVPLLAVSTPAGAVTPTPVSSAAETTIVTLRIPGAAGFVGIGTADGAEQAHTDATVADTVRLPAPGTTGPIIIRDRCFSPANGPGLPFALLVDAADPSRCLAVRTVATAGGGLRVVGADPLSLVDGLTLEQAPDSTALRFGDIGSDFEIVTRGEFDAPELTTTTISVGDPLAGTAQPGAHVVVTRGTDVLCETEAGGADDAHPGSWSCVPDGLVAGEHDLDLYGVSAAGQPAGPRSAHVTVTTGTDPGTGPTTPAPEPDPGAGTGTGSGSGSGSGPAPRPAPTADTRPTTDTSRTASGSTSAHLPGRLAYTGAEVARTGAAAAGLIGLGTALQLLRRRMRRS
ncbi:hypothetical protein [Curtobacterium sp. MCBD17_032]|uniref:hypothetical protein n=1 Tax=Curtobacterium sp. MCBD17_032 TaxID=2175659 RepID=UPI000DA84BC0|nr:hypothetical protein [Curtobacterium sp. MCBD17_032]PZE85049.1 hypothetical protein DEI91_06280 [Curtobacterium sp. MCBD17_032]